MNALARNIDIANSAATHLGTLRPTSYAYVGIGLIRVTLATETGAEITFDLTTTGMFEAGRLSAAMVSGHTAQIFRDMGEL